MLKLSKKPLCTVGLKKKREMKFDLMLIGNLICQFMSICACLTVVFLTHK
jgi:hypothetical protein